jgi:peptidoglycan/LPS O-acetylase OafA/YrhL
LPIPKTNPWLGSAVGFGAVLAGSALVEASGAVGTVPGYALVGAGCALVVVSVVGLPAPPRPVLHLGRISYGLYVYHVLATELVLRQFRGGSPALYLCGAIIGLLATIAVSEASYRLYEKRFLRLKRRFEIIPTAPVQPGSGIGPGPGPP